MSNNQECQLAWERRVVHIYYLLCLAVIITPLHVPQDFLEISSSTCDALRNFFRIISYLPIS
jgi:hypothetical protein